MATGRGLRLRLRFLGHPVHPMLVHLPMGLLLTAPLWDLLSLARPAAAPFWSTVGAWTLGVGCLGGLGAAVAGLVDFAARPAGSAATLHLYLIMTALALYGSSVLVRHSHPGGVSPGVLALDVGGVLFLAAGGFFGAEMVYRHGIGRESATETGRVGYHPERT
jgi:uncharacterized membrane protein